MSEGFIEVNQKYRLFFKSERKGWPSGAIYFIEGITLYGTLQIRGYGAMPNLDTLERVEVI